MVIPEGSNTKEWAGIEEAQVVQETGVDIKGVVTTPRPEGRGEDIYQDAEGQCSIKQTTIRKVVVFC